MQETCLPSLASLPGRSSFSIDLVFRRLILFLTLNLLHSLGRPHSSSTLGEWNAVILSGSHLQAPRLVRGEDLVYGSGNSISINSPIQDLPLKSNRASYRRREPKLGTEKHPSGQFNGLRNHLVEFGTNSQTLFFHAHQIISITSPAAELIRCLSLAANHVPGAEVDMQIEIMERFYNRDTLAT